VGPFSLVPNPVWGGVAFPLVVLCAVALWPWAERKLAGDGAFRNLLERARDNPVRTALGAAFVTWVFLIFVSGSGDRIDVWLGIDYVTQVWAYRIAALVLPVVVFFVTRRVCRELLTWEAVRRR